MFKSTIAILLTLASTSVSGNFVVAKEKCVDRCGNNSTIEITSISLDGQLRILQFVARDCCSRNGTRVFYNTPWISLPVYLTVNNTTNKFTVVGCDTHAFISGRRKNKNYQTGCSSMCDSQADLARGPCSGLGCCQMAIPEDIWSVNVSLMSYDNLTNVWGFNNCSYGFLVKEREFRFSPRNLSSLRNVEKLPMVVDWAIGNGTCEEAEKNMSSYACKSVNSKCYKPSNGYGYRCACSKGYQGNLYLPDGCQDVDECQDPKLSRCVKQCENTIGGYRCVCPKGYHGDGKRGGRGCIRNPSFILKLVAGIALGISVLLLAACWLYLELKRRKLNKMKHRFFLQNGGMLLQEKLLTKERAPDIAKIFTSSELKNATNNFHDSRIIGRGGFGIVYKGFLSDNRIVAIKKSKEVDPNQVEQFINEVIILSQINHRNVVRLLGCCLENQVPLLVYEFIDNGTLFEHMRDKTKARALSWDKRLTIAAKTGGVLAYLHSAASPPIIHRDVKSANILLNTSFTAKVSDFGASRLIHGDQIQISTMVQGTFGYLDPEYMQTNQLTDKSDVYSFRVVLLELLTGKKVISYDRAEEERNLSNYFLSMLKQNKLFEVLDDNIVREGNSEALIRAAMLAKRCLYVRGDDRPNMKEATMELEGLRLSENRSRVQIEPNEQEMESLVGEHFSVFSIGGGNSSTSIEYDNMRDQFFLPSGSAR